MVIFSIPVVKFSIGVLFRGTRGNNTILIKKGFKQ